MDDLEAEIRHWTDVRVAGVEPVSALEAVSLASSHPRRRRLLVALTAALVTVAVTAGAAVVELRPPNPVKVKTSGTSQDGPTTTMCQRITTAPSTVPPVVGGEAGNPLIKASLAPDGKVHVGSGLTGQTGWVTWAAFQDGTRPAPVTDAAGHLVGYFGHTLGWIDISTYNGPCFNYPALVAAAKRRTDAAVNLTHTRAVNNLVLQYAALSRQAGAVQFATSPGQAPSPTAPGGTTYQLKDARGSFTATATEDAGQSILALKIGTTEYDFRDTGLALLLAIGHHTIG